MSSELQLEKSAVSNSKIPFIRSQNLPGIGLTVVIGLIAHSLGKDFPLIGGAVIAIVIGVLMRQFLVVPEVFFPGIGYTLKKLLKLAIILLGFSFSFSEIFQLGINTLIIVLVAVILGIGLTYFIGRLFKLKGNIPLLISLGTGICGATAIATTGPILKAKDEDIVYAVNTIFAFNVLAVLVYPLIGHLLSMPDSMFGAWAGTAIHDTSSVVAAGYSYSTEAGDASVVIKLMRTLMLVPVAVLLSIYISFKNKTANSDQKKVKMSKVFPFFILFFAGAAAINTIFPLPSSFIEPTTFIAKFVILMVMASVGLGTDLKKIKSVGIRPLMVGLISSIIMGAISLLLIIVLF
ncbi:putative sulfate exporter family transporter [Bacillus sp. DTU_2020_1000418_1_SI_GHA_SEK_038]|uniref:YeiH family protein n=1 Tax=Bacillus sp. DTU_2020_1000418_1_SI_GHA_SEK_038 TaxID=3077585 RepID=UPI0028EAEA29|nr:putative sulfate exporter family transporter [Bacillus sp. DTU_2020_1000418_1_SI_GHA_SEK_038]WNS76216.1 putative sulfate exporter family transporter [Bacillus sp. DTU_2020_1000418_1_SI_GHA_SEK_038]